MVERSPDAILIHADEAIVFANPAAAALVGAARPEDLVGRPVLDIVHPGAHERVASNIGIDLQGKESPSITLDLLRDDGTTVPVQGRGARIPFGGRLAVQVVLRDIREQQRTEAVLRETRDYLDSLIDHANAPIIVWDPDLRITRFNAAFEHMAGYAANEVIGRDLAMLFPEESREAALAEIERTSTEQWESVEIPIQRPDGEVRIALWNSATISTPDGTALLATIAQGQDITERIEAEEALRESDERQAFLLELSDALRPLDDPVAVQEAAVRALGEHLQADRVYYTEVEDEGDADLFIVRTDYHLPGMASYAGRHPFTSVSQAAYARAKAGETLAIADTQTDPVFTEADRAAYCALSIGAYIAVPLVKQGRPAAYLTVHQTTPRTWTPAEVSLVEETAERTWAAVERARAEAALRQYSENLRRSNEDLERFAYVASHDLQEPLRSIVSFTQLLDRRYHGKLDTEADEFIDFIVEGGNRMQRLILDLLAFSRVNTTRQQIATTDAEDVLAEAERSLDAQLREAEATLTHDPLPVVMADPIQLAQVFSKLVSNAIKFRKPDEPLRVHVGACRLDGFWEFSVSDNGIGIEPEYFEKIFVIFQRLHTKDAYPGTGIGLAIVKRIVDRHGGTIRVESTPGEGTTFLFTLPAA